MLILLLPFTSYAQSCPVACDKQGACAQKMMIGSKQVNFYSNFNLNKTNRCIDHVIYVVHGTERNAESRYFAVLNAAKSMQKENRVLIISPFFKTAEDNPTSKEYYWSDSGWKKGDYSVNNGDQLSSFTVADKMLETVIENGLFPSLTHVTVTGHSAGGQYTQLYALTSSAPDQSALPYQYLVLNPSNYSYLNELRPHPSVQGLFEQPVYWDGASWKMKPEYEAVAGRCPDTYNNYKFGLMNRNRYASQLPVETLITQYIKRKVYYLLGSLDIDPNDPALDTTCSAELQGPFRLKRGNNFYQFLNQYYPYHQHTLAVVPNVGHDGAAMYGSTVVKNILFS